jgi:HAD superfamily hydrolase (TIGR01509 family)
MAAYEAVLFDFDGVLVDSEPLHFACWRDTLAPLGVHLDWKTYLAKCRGISDLNLLEALSALHEPPLDLNLLFEVYAQKKQRFCQLILEGEPIASEVRALLESLGNYRLAVVTSNGRVEVEPVLTMAGVRHYFDEVVCREDAPRPKPAPDPYRKAAELLHATRVLVVEDSAVGIASGKAAGFDVVAVPSVQEMPALVRQALQATSESNSPL